MKKLLFNILYFSLPIVFPILVIEIYLRNTKNAFITKAEYLNLHSDIELLILGSSHNQNNINPRYLNIKASNLAYGMQDLQLDSALLINKIKTLKNLKFIIIELD